MMTLIAGASVAKEFGLGRRRRKALRDVSFGADAGEIVGVVGPNGAGKTTLLELIAGDLVLTSGELWIAGHRAGSRQARRAVGMAPDPPVAPSELTGVEWLSYLASYRTATGRDRVRRVHWAMELAEIAGFCGRRIGEYSRGMAQRLSLAAAAISAESVVVLDEVLSGIDPLVQRRLRARIAALASEERVVVVASHDLATIERLATRVLVLWDGRLVADVSTAALVGERVAELALTRADGATTQWLLDRFPGAARTDTGVAVPLAHGLTVERLLGACRERRIAVAASHIRYRALEDLLVDAERRGGA